MHGLGGGGVTLGSVTLGGSVAAASDDDDSESESDSESGSSSDSEDDEEIDVKSAQEKALALLSRLKK